MIEIKESETIRIVCPMCEGSKIISVPATRCECGCGKLIQQGGKDPITGDNRRSHRKYFNNACRLRAYRVRLVEAGVKRMRDKIEE